MPLSVSRPVGLAIARSKHICFQPFDAGKWFALGFCAFLANLGQSGGSGLQNSFRGAGRPGRGTSDFVEWSSENFAVVFAVGAAVLLAVIGLGLLLSWLSCRGRFMLLDGVVRNRGAVVAPWHALRDPANSLFKFYIVFMLVGMGVALAGLGACMAIAWPDLRSERFGDAGMAAVVLAIVLFVPFSIAMALIQLIVRDFVVPTMYLRGEGIRAAWTTVSREVVAGNGSTLLLYVLMKIALAMGMGVIAVIVVLVTCCIAALPYLGTVILLPLFVFSQCYPLYFLEQLGPNWQFFPAESDGPYCRTCGYNLRGNLSGMCSECGTPINVDGYQPPQTPPITPR